MDFFCRYVSYIIYERMHLPTRACFSGPPVLTVHMTSDNDGDSAVVSSGCSGFPSPVPGAKTGGVPATAAATATAAKGILVHNNKKSGNMNRVSFVTNSSSSSSSSLSPSTSAEQSKKRHNQPRRTDDDIPLPYHARTGRRLTGFGVKSYLHEFYDDPDGSESFQVRIIILLCSLSCFSLGLMNRAGSLENKSSSWTVSVKSNNSVYV